jgi:hypothetical protein
MQIQSVRNPNANQEICKGFVRKKPQLNARNEVSSLGFGSAGGTEASGRVLTPALTTDIDTLYPVWALIVRFSPATLTTHNNPQNMSQCMLAENVQAYTTMSDNELGIELATGSIEQYLYWVQVNKSTATQLPHILSIRLKRAVVSRSCMVITKI